MIGSWQMRTLRFGNRFTHQRHAAELINTINEKSGIPTHEFTPYATRLTTDEQRNLSGFESVNQYSSLVCLSSSPFSHRSSVPCLAACPPTYRFLVGGGVGVGMFWGWGGGVWGCLFFLPGLRLFLSRFQLLVFVSFRVFLVPLLSNGPGGTTNAMSLTKSAEGGKKDN